MIWKHSHHTSIPYSVELGFCSIYDSIEKVIVKKTGHTGRGVSIPMQFLVKLISHYDQHLRSYTGLQGFGL